MAGIGFALRKLTQRDDLLGMVQGYVHSALVIAGPWLFTVTALGALNLLAAGQTSLDELVVFRLVVIYNFSFSLVLTGPIVLVATRYLADQIFLRTAQEAPGMMLGALALVFGTGAVVVLPFYGWYVDLPPLMRLSAIANYFLVAGVWTVGMFLSALRDYMSITWTFLIGMIVAAAAAFGLAGPLGAFGLLNGVSFGIGIILFALIARVLAEYPYRIHNPFGFVAYFRKYWELAASGLVVNLALWVDKWIMWFAPERELHPSGLVTYPAYDSAMFLAAITMIPAMAVFVVAIETRFYEHYQRFYRDIGRHAPYARIRENHERILRGLLDSSRNVLVLQACIVLVVILLAPGVLGLIGAGLDQIGIFRFGVLGSLFQVMLMFTFVVIAYFDLRRLLLGLQCLFLLANAGFTLVTLKLGFPYYGYGFFLATVFALVVAYTMTAKEVSRLPYLTFVRNNASVD